MSKIRITSGGISLFLIICIGVILFFGIKMINNETKRVFEEYPLLKSIDRVNETILKHDIFKGTILIKTVKGNNFSIISYNYSIQEKKHALHYHLEKGDSISRNANSDTLYLHKKIDGSIVMFEVRCID